MIKVKFGDVVKRANTIVDKDNTDLIYYVGGEHFDSNELTITRRGLIEGSTIGPMFYFGFKAGQVLVVSRNPHLRKAAVVNFDGICSEKTFVIETFDSEILLQEFLPFIVQSNSFWKFAEENKSGSVNFFVNWSTFAKYEFNLPPIEDQAKLAELLWAVNKTKESYKSLLAETDKLVKVQFNELFKECHRENIGDICEIKARIGWQGLTKKEYLTEGDYHLVTGVDFKDNRIDFANCFFVTENRYNQDDNIKLRPEDVLVTKDGTIGKVAIVEDLSIPATLNSGVFVVRDLYHKVRSWFLYYSLMTDEFNSFIEECKTGTTIAHLNQSAFINYKIPVPQLLDQDSFIRFARKANESKNAIKRSLNNLEQYRNALMEKFFDRN